MRREAEEVPLASEGRESITVKSLIKKESKRKLFWLISIFYVILIVLLIIFLASHPPTKNKLTTKPVQEQTISTQPKAKENKNHFIGAIRYSGLRPEAKKELELQAVEYQLAIPSYNRKKTDPYGYFLKNENQIQLDELLGKCVEIKGSVLTTWQSQKANDYYRMQIMVPEQVKRLDYSDCLSYPVSDPTTSI